ncbi:hypothetical protein OIO90_001966 [Microbotryomycetes sp. JL221]|nr:hypothetical protein OIO90_001966 [Microbotryomycetes sp. JL221]
MTSFVEADLLPASLERYQQNEPHQPSIDDSGAALRPSFSSSSSSSLVTLPSVPRASVSPSTERVAWRQGSNKAQSTTNDNRVVAPSSSVPVTTHPQTDSSPLLDSPTRPRHPHQTRSGRGLDLSKPLEPYQAHEQPQQPSQTMAATTRGGGVRDRVAQMNANNGVNTDPRDTASIRDNILSLTQQGAHSQSNAGQPVSLASFMGGASKAPRLHRINQGPTEAEQQEMDRIEQEMKATRSKWSADSNASAAGNSTSDRPQGPSLASLLNQSVQGSDAAVRDKVTQRWQPSVPSKPASLSAGQKSMATAFGSTAVGPRLNSQPQYHTPEDDGPMHARRQPGDAGYGLPGLVAARASSSSSSGTQQSQRGISQQVKSSPAFDDDDDKTTTPSSPSKRNSVIDRWGRDEPKSSPTKPIMQSPTEMSSSRPFSNDNAATQSGRSWSTTSALVTNDKPIESKYSRSPALPGISSPAAVKPTSTATFPPPGVSSTSLPSSHSKSPSMSKSDSGGGGGSRPSSPVSVRDAAKLWGQKKESLETKTRDEALALKASYGVKVPEQSQPPAAMSSPRLKQEQAKENKLDTASRPFDAALERSTAIAAPTSFVKPVQPQTETPSTREVEAAPSRPTKSELTADQQRIVNQVISLCSQQSTLSTGLPGESISFDVYSLLSNDAQQPIAHNHLCFSTEILAVVNRSADASHGDERVETQVFVWTGRDVPQIQPTKIQTTLSKILKLNNVTNDQVIEIQNGQETKAFGQVFGDQVTIMRGLREEFDHLETRLYGIREQDDIVIVEERELTSSSLCSGFSVVFSIVGEVYAWYGNGSTRVERQAALEFAESIADGRQVTELREGSEVAYFWHALDALEYASAPYWKHRLSNPTLSPSVVEFIDAEPTLSKDMVLKSDQVTLIDGAFGDHWVLVPERTQDNEATGQIKLALEAAERLADKWQERGLSMRNQVKVGLELSHHKVTQKPLGLTSAMPFPGFATALSSAKGFASLQDELKAWEASFKLEHGREPSRQDIKAAPDIAAKYKLYQKSKTTSATTTTTTKRVAASDATSATPRKERASGTTKQVSTTANSNEHQQQTYVLAQSPSKLKQLAVRHSTFRSPNKQPVDGREKRDVVMMTSPSKFNPFASSSSSALTSQPYLSETKTDLTNSQRNLFAHEILRRQTRDEQKRKELLGTGTWKRAHRTQGGASDEKRKDTKTDKDNLFLVDPTARTTKERQEQQHMDIDRQDHLKQSNAAEDDDDEILGLSPVKPAITTVMAGSSKPVGLFDSLTRANTFASTSSLSSSLSSLPPPPLKLFNKKLQQFKGSRVAEITSAADGEQRASRDHPGLHKLRGVKRNNSVVEFDQDVTEEAGSEDERGLVSEASEVSDSEHQNRKSTKSKRTRTRTKGSSKPRRVTTSESTRDDKKASTRTRTAGSAAFKLEIEPDEENGVVKKILVRPPRPLHEYRKRVDKVAQGVKNKDKGKGKAVDVDEEGDVMFDEQLASQVSEEDDLSDRDDVSLLRQVDRQRNRHAFVTSDMAHSTLEHTTRHDDDDDDDEPTIDLPADLAAILNLKSSPVKKTLRRREREQQERVRALLLEPSVVRRKTGLLDLQDEDDNPDQSEEGSNDMRHFDVASDDDWDSDAEGWKDLGDGEMDEL